MIKQHTSQSPELQKPVRRITTLAMVVAACIILLTPAVPARAVDYDVGSAGRLSFEVNKSYVEGLKRMTQEFLVVMKQHTLAIGMMFDATAQLDTQRLYQQLNAEASKDYQPSEMMCQYGTFIRSVALAEEKSKTDRDIISNVLIETYTNKKHVVPEKGTDADMISRIATFKTTYCDPADNNSGLKSMCEHPDDPTKIGGQDPNRFNKDINYAAVLAKPLSLDINYTDTDKTADEQDIYHLARHLYWAESFAHLDDENKLLYNPADFAEARRLMAMQSVAHNSFSNIVAQKTRTDVGIGEKSGWNHMKALMKDFGLSDEEVNEHMGDFPSYYAQMEVLTKKMYQSPDFYTNLYDKPANIARISTSMEAISLMQGRDQYKSALRRQMLLSMLLEQKIAQRTKKNLF